MTNEQFWDHVDASGDCWEWVGYRDPRGYGRVRPQEGGSLAHRVAWTLLCGPIPKGLTLDHLCRNHSCVNPAHLEPVTQRLNALRGFGWAGRHARKTHCVNGHLFDSSNTRLRDHDGHPERVCIACEVQRPKHDPITRWNPTDINAAKSECIYGHLFSEENTVRFVWKGKRVRQCRACRKKRNIESKARVRARAKANAA